MINMISNAQQNCVLKMLSLFKTKFLSCIKSPTGFKNTTN